MARSRADQTAKLAPLVPTFLLASALLVQGCGVTHETVGDGQLVDTSVDVASFRRVVLTNSLVVELSPGEIALALHVDENLEPEITARVVGDTLVLDGKRANTNLSFSMGAEIRAAAPLIEQIVVSESATLGGAVSSNDLTLEAKYAAQVDLTVSASSSLSATLTGGSAVALHGTAGALTIDASFSAQLDSDLRAQTLSIVAADSARVEVFASGSLQVRAGDSAVVVVHGNPATRDVQTTESATVSFED